MILGLWSLWSFLSFWSFERTKGTQRTKGTLWTEVDLSFSAGDGLFVPFDREPLCMLSQASGVDRSPVSRVGFGAKMGEHVVAAALVALGTKSRQINGADNDFFSRPGVGLGEDAT